MNLVLRGKHPGDANWKMTRVLAKDLEVCGIPLVAPVGDGHTKFCNVGCSAHPAALPKRNHPRGPEFLIPPVLERWLMKCVKSGRSQ